MAGQVKGLNGVALRSLMKAHARRVGLGCCLAAATCLLAGCAVSQITKSFRSKSDEPSWAPTVSEERLLEAARTDTTGQVDLASTATDCPKFTVWPRDKMLTIYEIGQVGDGLAIVYRGEITKAARECQFFPGRVTMKYGFAGRVLLGPKGRPGPITLPLKVHVTDKSRNRIATEDVRISVTIAPDNPVGFFSTVREISFAVPPGVPPRDYRVFIAFDRSTPGAG